MRIVVIPALIFLASTGEMLPRALLKSNQLTTAFAVIAVIMVIAIARPGAHSLTGIPVRLDVIRIALTVSLNVILTGSICFRLISARNRLQAVFSRDHENIHMYTGVIAILVESAAPVAIFGVALAATYGTGNVTGLAFGQIWGPLLVCTPFILGELRFI